MKNLVIVALTSLLLFSVSAGLSLWLKQSKEESAQSAEAKKDDKEKKKGTDDHAKPADKDAVKPAEKEHAKPTEKDHESPKVANDELATKRDKLDKLKQQFEIVQHDLRTQQDALAKLMREVAVESKAVKTLADDAENRAAILKGEKETAEKALQKANEKADATAKKPVPSVPAVDPKNVEKTVQILEKLEPTDAAAKLQSLADTGDLDLAVNVLSRMKDSKAAGILSAMDKDFSNQLVKKILASRSGKAAEPQK
jgi:hypothetical protein